MYYGWVELKKRTPKNKRTRVRSYTQILSVLYDEQLPLDVRNRLVVHTEFQGDKELAKQLDPGRHRSCWGEKNTE
jgi:type IV secretory pathway VirB9-like protein